MSSEPAPLWRGAAAVLAVVAVIGLAYLVGLDGFGLWEPWEADRLEETVEPEGEADDAGDEAPRIGENGEWARGPLVRDLHGLGYSDGADEGAVRLPTAIAAFVGLLACLLLGLALFGRRVGLYSTVILAGLPLYLAMGRLVVWSSLPVTATTMILGGAAVAVFGPWKRGVNAGVGLVVLVAGALLGATSAGVAMGLAAPLGGAALGLLFARAFRVGWPGIVVTALVCVLALAAAGRVALLFLGEGYLETGDTGTPPTFELYLRQLLLGCFPWTGLIVAGLGLVMQPAPEEDERGAGAVVVLATGAALILVAQGLWSRLAGAAPFLALWPLAVAAGRLLERAEEEPFPRRLAAAIFLLFLALGLRDHLLEPDVVLVPLADSGASLPEGWSGRAWLAVVTAVVGLPTALALARGGGRHEPGGYRQWAARWLGWLAPRGRSWTRWLVPAIPALLLLHAGMTAMGLGLLWFPYMSCIERRIWLAAGLLVPVGLAAAFGGKLLWDLAGRLGRLRVVAAVGAGAVVAVATSHVAIPSLSRHLSSRGVAQAHEELSGGEGVLLSHRASTPAVELLGATKIEQEASLERFVGRLTEGEGVYGIIKASDLARVDARFRKLTGGHLPVVDDSSAKLYLVAGAMPSGQESRNPLEKVVPLERPRPSRPVYASFDDRIELLGVDIEGPGGGPEVCPIDSFVVRYYWRCVRPVSGSYKIFVHVDGYGLRINGDHEPAEGLYSVRDWQGGDFVVDEQRLKVPAHFRPGDYTIYVGFFQGSRRLPVKDGPATRDDRVRAGILRVQ